MNTFEIFTSMLNPVLLVDKTGKIRQANDAIETLIGVSVRQVRGTVFPSSLGFQLDKPIDYSSITDVTPYKEIDFKTAKKAGTLSYSVQAYGEDQWLIVIYDLTIEKSLHYKYKNQLINNESLSNENLTQKAELLLSRDELERKVSQMTFLLGFYDETRFILEPNMIAETFLKIACNNIGFMSGIYFYSTPGKEGLQVGPTYSLDEDSLPLTNRELVLEPAEKSRVGVSVYRHEEIKDCPIYKSLGIISPLNSVVVSLTRDSRILGQFHLVNYFHNAELDENTLELLGYMLSPLTLTFENAELYRTSVTDELSQINNVRYFRMRLQNELKRAERDNVSLCLLLFDIDHFKKVNDTYGHPAGDRVIYAVATCLKESVRSTDIVARYGGEEMVIILPGASPADAQKIAEKIRKRVSELKFDHQGTPFSVTISGGISNYPLHALTEEELIQQSDQALYQSKSNGRNQNTLATPLTKPEA